MLLPSAFGILASGSGGGGGYTAPAMNRTGVVGNIAANAAGYGVSGFDNGSYCYLAAGKTTGKWYWEAESANFILFGVTTTPASFRTFGGYSSINGGIYNFGGTFWNEWGAVPPSLGTIAVGVVIGFALDVPGKTLRIYLGNVLADTIALTGISGAIYPMFAFQSSPTTQVRLGPSGCTYTPPSGYTYI